MKYKKEDIKVKVHNTEFHYHVQGSLLLQKNISNPKYFLVNQIFQILLLQIPMILNKIKVIECYSTKIHLLNKCPENKVMKQIPSLELLHSKEKWILKMKVMIKN